MTYLNWIPCCKALLHAKATAPSSPLPPRLWWSSPLTLKTLFEFRGTQANPVKGVTFSGITFTGAATTFLDPHGVPSGGDWALQRSAAIFIEGSKIHPVAMTFPGSPLIARVGCITGTEDTTIDQCLMTRLDGNAVMLSGYNRAARITASTF